jgi:hypothetical protein
MKIMKLFKRILLVVIVLLVVIQFIPNKLPQAAEGNKDDIMVSGQLKSDIANIIKTSCYDCHSNHTHFPWYSRVAPVSWLIASDVKEGRRKLNFSEWGSYDKRHKITKLGNIKEQVKGNEMPLFIYTVIHVKAKLNDSQKDMIIKWTNDFGNQILGQ